MRAPWTALLAGSRGAYTPGRPNDKSGLTALMGVRLSTAAASLFDRRQRQLPPHARTQPLDPGRHDAAGVDAALARRLGDLGDQARHRACRNNEARQAGLQGTGGRATAATLQAQGRRKGGVLGVARFGSENELPRLAAQ